MRHILYALSLLLLVTNSIAQDSSKISYHLFKPVPRHLMREDMETDRPGITESPYTIDAGHLQYESDIVRYKTASKGGNIHNQWLVNPFTVKLGLAHKLALQLIYEPYRWEEHKEFSGSDTVYHNGGSLAVRVKYNIIGSDKGNLSLAILPFIKLPTHNFFEHHRFEYGLVIPAQLKLGEKWSLGFQEQIDWEAEEEAYGWDFMESVSATYELNKHFKVICESACSYNFKEQEVANYFNLALQYGISRNFALDAGIQQSVQNENGHQFYTGLAFRL